MQASILKKYVRYYAFLRKNYDVTRRKPLVVKEAVKDTLYNCIHDPDLYAKLYLELYVFYVIFAQNTNDVYTIKVINKIYEDLKRLDFNYDLSIYRNYFYKHKDESVDALRTIVRLLRHVALEEKITFHHLTSIKRIGIKSASLILNEFCDGYVWPVVDVHVIKGYNIFCKKFNLNTETCPDRLAIKLTSLNNFCDFNVAYDFASLLYYHRKFRCSKIVNKPCVHPRLCTNCSSLKS